MFEKLTTVEVRAALERPSEANLAAIKRFWHAVLDQAETETDTMYWHASWHKLKRDQANNTEWSEELNNARHWAVLNDAVSRLVERFAHAARQVVLRAEGNNP